MERELGLGSTLAALKHYFLLDRGDLLMTFLDTADGELGKPATEASLGRLQALLDLGTNPGQLIDTDVAFFFVLLLFCSLLRVVRAHNHETLGGLDRIVAFVS
jgi:hypothetical protein